MDTRSNVYDSMRPIMLHQRRPRLIMFIDDLIMFMYIISAERPSTNFDPADVEQNGYGDDKDTKNTRTMEYTDYEDSILSLI